MTTEYDEWLKQAEYDLKAAERMLQSDLPAHATFTIHLALEKILKAYYIKIKDKIPPKTHSLLYFAGELPLNLPDDGQSLLEELEGMGIEARYPPDLDATLKRLPHDTVEITIARSKKVFSWIKQELTR
jgi:HEPN domain-containing protein